MKNLLSLIIIGALSLTIFSGCKKDEDAPTTETGTFEFKFIPTIGGSSLELDQTYQNPQNQNLTPTMLKMYVSNVRLIKTDGSEVLVKEVHLFDFGATGKTHHGAGLYFTVNAPVGDYQGVKYCIGIPDSINKKDPAVYPAAHPMSVNQGMHWSWNTGYIFLKLEAKLDTAAADKLDLAYHLGGTSLFKELEVKGGENAFKIEKGKERSWVIETDLNKWFAPANAANSVVMKDSPMSHSMMGDPVAPKIMNNAVSSFIYYNE